jgi:hypothetical protein
MLLLVCHNALASAVGRDMGVSIYQSSSSFLLARLCLGFCWCLSLQNLLWWFCWIEGGTLQPAPINWDPYSLFVVQLISVKAHSFQLGALSFSKHFCCTWWEGTWLCNLLLMSPISALMTVFLESLGSLHIFAIIGSILLVGRSRKGMVPVS